MENKHEFFLKLDIAKFFPAEYWNALPEIRKSEYKRQFAILQKYDNLRQEVNALCGNDNLIRVIEKESEDYSQRISFVESIKESLLFGADYSACETIEEISKVHTDYLLQKLACNIK